MTFFEAQKKLIRLWFIWTLLLLAYVGFQTMISTGVFHPNTVAQKMWEWIGKYLASLFVLIMGSSFFSKMSDNPVLKDPIYFKLSWYTSLFYLTTITIMIFLIVFSCEDFTSFIQTLANTSLMLNFLLPIVTGLLGYFFYKNKIENAPETKGKGD
jgi:uncharacterized membrane protein